MSTEINIPTAVIAAAHSRWKRNRDMIAGEDAIKAARTEYLPQIANQSREDYDRYLARVPVFPGAARTHAGLIGLITRKPPTVEAPAGVLPWFDTITQSGHSVEDLSDEMLSENLITGFPGMLIDHPTASEPMTAAQAEAAGHRPFIAPYKAASILEVTPGIWNNKQTLVRVRLLDDEATVRELVLDEGIYRVIIHRADKNGQWTAEPPITPLRLGKPLNEIPFVLCSPKARAFDPVKGPLDDLCWLNVHCYHAQADAMNSRFYSSAPIFAIFNVEQPKTPLAINPGTVVYLNDKSPEMKADAKFVEFSGAGQKTLEEAVATFKDEMAKVGSNILASERTAAEAAETHQIRRASENSLLAGIARGVARKIEAALNWVAWWGGYEEKVTFTLNTDFVPTAMSAQDRTAALAELQAGAISFETFWQMLISGEVLPEDFNMEEERARIIADLATMDRPTGEEEETQDPPVE